ncbi:MAG: hypothetical protein LBQ89_01120 [Treponema sp.]|jgi:hypothetical protein|nr:hypothetical protein [Treponema sp.]
MNVKLKITVFAASLAAVLSVPFFIFVSRSPVLIVTDQSFVSLYGEARIRCETFLSSLSLFRPVKIVEAVDDAGGDIVRFAVEDFSSRPYCVLFPLRFIHAARLYSEYNPGVPVVLLEGRRGDDDIQGVSDGENGYYSYKTDIDMDFYRAGIAAAALGMGKDGKIAVFLEPRILAQAREAFLRAVEAGENPRETLFFTSFSQYTDIPGLSCVVLAGAGAEFLETGSGVPVILFSWIDPKFVPAGVVLVVNDSPWVQIVEAVRMAAAGSARGLIQSEFRFIGVKNINRETLRKIQKPD